MDVGTRVALAACRDFTGTVDRVDGDLITVKFDVDGTGASSGRNRGWLRRGDLVEIKPALETEGTPS